MAFLHSSSRNALSHSKLNCDDPLLLRRKFHIELGAREKALLEEDSALKKFKSYKRSVWQLKRVGDVLTIVVVAGCCYEVYARAQMKNAAVAEALANNKKA